MASSTSKNLVPRINGNALVDNKTSANLGIGTNVTDKSWTTSIAVSNNSIKVYSSFSLEAGVWLATLTVDWPATNNTGQRNAFLSPNNDTASWTDYGRGSCYVVPGCSSMSPTITTTVLINLSATTTIYIKLWQNSGVSVNVSTVRVHCVRF